MTRALQTLALVGALAGCVGAFDESTAVAEVLAPTLTTDSATYTPGQPITATWTSLPGNAHDWVALAPFTSEFTVVSRWVYTNGAIDGAKTFTGLSASGLYEARAFSNDGYQLLARSATFSVASSSQVSTNLATYGVGQTIVASWSGLPGNLKDWIALAPAGSPPTTISRYVYTNGAASGSYSFPGLATGGSYVVRAFVNDSYTQIADAAFSVASVNVTTDRPSYAPNENIQVTWSGLPGASTDWISLAPAGSSATTVTRWFYTGGAASGSRVFSGLPTTGLYVARAYPNDSYAIAAQSAAFVIGVVSQVASGALHTCAIVNGGVHCWGYNLRGQLGNNTTVHSSVPIPVPGLASGVQAIAAGVEHTCAIVNGGAVCWGRNHRGQLGDFTTTDRTLPVPVFGLTAGVEKIAAGGEHTCAVVNGGAKCWGLNRDGALGNGGMFDSSIPVDVAGLASSVQSIVAGLRHTCAIANGAAWCWGYNETGTLGNGTIGWSRVPVAVSGLTSGVQVIDAGAFHTCARVNSGAWCWGSNVYGQLGNTDATGQFLVPVQVPGLGTGVQGIDIGALHSCAVVNGGAWCWGNNEHGQVGNNSTNNSYIPVAVLGLPSGVQAVAGGNLHTCAIANNAVSCWGGNQFGTLGNGTNTHSLVPVPVAPWTPL